MARRPRRKFSKKELKAQKKVTDAANILVENNQSQTTDKTDLKKDAVKPVLEIPKIITVRDFSQKLNLPVTKVIAELMKNGVMASINESIDFDTAAIVGDELGYEVKSQKAVAKAPKKLTEEEKKHLQSRPPVVVVLGHVDHGKTTLLDAIRKSNVAAGESGGITQHIGAYQVVWKDKDKKDNLITFLDTPGHEAFSAMRAHGANITDIAILVVAADDGVKPQTKEAISHAKAAGVPIVVAINKIDKPEADIDRVKRELGDLGLVSEEWGGDTVMVPVSAKQNKNIDALLDIVLVIAALKDFKANPKAPASGVVIESHMQAGVGPIATVLVQNGTLEAGQVILVGSTFGKIRFMENYLGKRINSAGPSTPVKIAGLNNVPGFGESLQVTGDERTARNLIASKSINQRQFGLAQISEDAKAGKLEELKIILKADVQGSLEAIKSSLESLGGGKVKVKILSSAVGDINESDVNMAIASDAVIIGFKISLSPMVRKLAQEKGIKVSLYDIIYNLIDDISSALQGLLKPEFSEEIVGKLEVLKVFHSTPEHKIIGGKVIDGKLVNGLKAHLYHSGEVHGEGKIVTLQMEKNPVKEVLKGYECGLGIDTKTIIKAGDLIEPYQMIEELKKI